MFLEIKYYKNKSLIIPEALLEYDSTYEENLRQDLKEIDKIASSGDKKWIRALVTHSRHMAEHFDVAEKYRDMLCFLHESTNSILNEPMEEFKKRLSLSNIVNQDVSKDSLLEQTKMIGDYEWYSVFNCIFRYILYVKTKHMKIFSKYEVSFQPYPNGK